MAASLEYFPGDGFNIVTQPLKVTGRNRDFNFSVLKFWLGVCRRTS